MKFNFHILISILLTFLILLWYSPTKSTRTFEYQPCTFSPFSKQATNTNFLWVTICSQGIWMWNLMLLLRTQEDDENKSNLVNGFKLLKCRMWFRHLKCPWCKYFPKSNNALLRISLCKLVHSIQLIIYLSSLIHNKHLKIIKTSDESYLYKTLRWNVIVHVNWTAHHKHH